MNDMRQRLNALADRVMAPRSVLVRIGDAGVRGKNRIGLYRCSCGAEKEIELGINYAALQRRFKLNWTVEKAFTEPVKPRPKLKSK